MGSQRRRRKGKQARRKNVAPESRRIDQILLEQRQIEAEHVTTGEPSSSAYASLVLPDGSPPPEIDMICFNDTKIVEQRVTDVEDALKERIAGKVLWVNVDGLGDAKKVHRLAEAFNLHRLTLEDIIHVHQRAKVEYFNTYVFVVVRMFSVAETLETEQLGIVVGKDYVLTFQEGKPGDVLEPVRDRLRQHRGGLRKKGPDYLMYALVDAVTDGYFPVLAHFADCLDGLEDEVLGQSYLDVIWRIHSIKRDLMTLHNSMLAQRDLVQSLMRDDHPLIGEDARLHLRDVADHIGQILDLLTLYREMAQALIEIHLNIASNKMNEVMQVLTLVSVIFIPLTFIAGVYGMNFDVMPELRTPWGYPLTLIGMLGTATAMLYFFRKRGWLQWPRSHEPPNKT
jgi:magnesium transporter